MSGIQSARIVCQNQLSIKRLNHDDELLDLTPQNISAFIENKIHEFHFQDVFDWLQVSSDTKLRIVTSIQSDNDQKIYQKLHLFISKSLFRRRIPPSTNLM